MQQNIVPIILTQKQKQLFMKVILMTYINQFIVQLYQTYKNHLEKIRVGLLIQLYIVLLIIRSTISELVSVISNCQTN